MALACLLPIDTPALLREPPFPEPEEVALPADWAPPRPYQVVPVPKKKDAMGWSHPHLRIPEDARCRWIDRGHPVWLPCSRRGALLAVVDAMLATPAMIEILGGRPGRDLLLRSQRSPGLFAALADWIATGAPFEIDYDQHVVLRAGEWPIRIAQASVRVRIDPDEHTIQIQETNFVEGFDPPPIKISAREVEARAKAAVERIERQPYVGGPPFEWVELLGLRTNQPSKLLAAGDHLFYRTATDVGVDASTGELIGSVCSYVIGGDCRGDMIPLW